MLKEIKYLIFIVVIALFIFLTGRYYFSDENKKKSYRSFQSIDKKNSTFASNLSILESDTENIIEYVENKVGQNKKTYHFWKLLSND